MMNRARHACGLVDRRCPVVVNGGYGLGGHVSTATRPRQTALHTITGMLDRSVSGHGCVIGVAGPAGIGKSRLVGEAVALAKSRGFEVFSAFCESHTYEIPFHVAAPGNPFFAEEIARELAERGVLRGEPGAYMMAADVAEVSVPATLQATIAARIDRLDPKAKRTLSAAAVVGSQFGLDLLSVLGIEPVVADLVAAQLVDQVRFTRQPAFVFHHPLIR